MDRSLTGPGLFGAGIRTVANVAAGPIKKATKVANIFRSSREERIDKAKDKLLDTVFGTPKDVQKQLDEPQKPKLAPGEKGIEDLADKAYDRNPVAKKQAQDAIKNAPKDEKIRKAVENTKKGTLERYKALKQAQESISRI